ncbi:MAG TPA: M23 family metallopeptidase [Planktothrix sp.]|jgi:murein DD-endopeptidase MepM/ murein hydrolase activator NlpD
MSKTRKLQTLAAAAVLSCALVPAQAYNWKGFQGYYCPQILISPMADNMMYTPVGMGLVTSKAGFRIHPVTGKYDFHSGVDLGAKLNDRVYNLLDGVVTRVGVRGALGVAVEIYHPYPNIRTIYGHLNAYAVLPGMFVQRGRVIGYAGSSGRSTGVHVHFTVIKNDTDEYIEPLQYLHLVPKYVAALKTARTQLANARSIDEMKKKLEGSQPVDSSSEDLPPEKKKS